MPYKVAQVRVWNKEINKMKSHFDLASVALALLLATSGGAIAHNVGSDVGKGARSMSYRTVKAARKTAAGTSSSAEKTSSASESDIQKTGQNR